MAKSKGNVVTYGLSGKIGDLLVFRQLRGQTIVSKMPVTGAKPTEKQAAQRKRFQQAVLYAKAAIEAPETGEHYKAAAKQKGKLPLNIAVADFFNAPDIAQIDLSGYTGNAGDTIAIQVTDDFAVKAVQVRIMNAAGAEIEKGAARQTLGSLWSYTAAQNAVATEGCKIVISASDLPGNISEAEKNFEL